MTAHIDRQHHNVTLAILAIGALGLRARADDGDPRADRDAARVRRVGTSDITWMVSAYFLAASVATPVLGRLGDMFGKERFLAVSLGAFAAGSVLCALSNGLELMIVGRVLQGVGGGVFPLSFGIVRDEFPLAKVPTGIALLGATAGHRRRDRPAARRPARRPGELPLDLLGRRRDGRRRDGHDDPLRPRVAAAHARPRRHRGRADPRRRPLGRADRGLARQPLGLGLRQDARPDRGRPARPRRLRGLRAPPQRAADQHAHARAAGRSWSPTSPRCSSASACSAPSC